LKPTEIKIHKKSATLSLHYPNESFSLSAEFLRVHSPSAEVQGHGPGQSVLQVGKRLVTFKDVIPQGHYAIKIIFSDGHDSGIYSWVYLRDLCDGQDLYWQQYLEQLEAKNASRDPQFIALN
jgi:DUF971 family protein